MTDLLAFQDRVAEHLWELFLARLPVSSAAKCKPAGIHTDPAGDWSDELKQDLNLAADVLASAWCYPGPSFRDSTAK